MALLGAILLITALLPGCASTVKVHAVKPQSTYQWLAASAPLSGELSPSTKQVLRIRGLSGLWESNPGLVLQTLDSLPRKNRDALFATVEISLLHARGTWEKTPKDAVGLYADAALRAWRYLFANPAHGFDPVFDQHALGAILAYDDAAARIVEILHDKRPAPAGGWEIPLPGQRTLLLRPGGGRWSFRDFRVLKAVDRLKLTGFEDRFTRFGLGAPFVGLIPRRHGTPDSPFFPPKGLAVPITAVIRFLDAGPGRKAQLLLLDARSHNRIKIAARWVPTAADFTAPYGYLASLGEKEIRKIGSVGMFSPEATKSLHRIILMEPYDPGKIPLVLVHGLWSNPSIWLPLTNELEGDPQLRKAYQVWYFLYPSGEPYLWTAAMFRDSLDRVRKILDPAGTNRNLNRMVLVGHSMGGLLVRTTVSNSGDILWKTIFAVPPARLRAPKDQVEKIEKALFFAPKPYVHRVIFLSTPQHGSRMAASIVGKLGSALVTLPHSFSQMLRQLAEDHPDTVTPRMRALFAKGGADAVRALRPDNPVMQAFARIPVSPRVPFHTIIGDRGLDGGVNASDGVVSWKSAHLPGAASETIVPCDHHSTANRQAMNTILDILRLNLQTAPGLGEAQPVSVGQRHAFGKDVLDLETPRMAHPAAVANVPGVVGDQP